MSRTVEITTDAPGFPVNVHRNHDHIDGGSFVAGLLVGAGGLFFAQRRRKRVAEMQEPRPQADAGRYEAEVEALRRRTATLERIVTEPATRLDREIDALR